MKTLFCIEPADWLADLFPVEVSLILIAGVVAVILVVELPRNK